MPQGYRRIAAKHPGGVGERRRWAPGRPSLCAVGWRRQAGVGREDELHRGVHL